MKYSTVGELDIAGRLHLESGKTLQGLDVSHFEKNRIQLTQNQTLYGKYHFTEIEAQILESSLISGRNRDSVLLKRSDGEPQVLNGVDLGEQ